MQRIKIIVLSICLIALTFVNCPTISYAATPTKFKLTELPDIGNVVLPAHLEAIRVQNAEIPKYNLTINDGKIIHFIQLSITDKPKRLITNGLSFSTDVSNIQKMIIAIQKSLIQNALNEGAKLINTYPIASAKIAPHEGWTGSYRTSIAKEIPSPMYTRIYLFSAKDKNLAIIYTCPDSDKIYWEPVMKQMISSLDSPVIIYRV